MHSRVTVTFPVISALLSLPANSNFSRYTQSCCTPSVLARCYFHLCQSRCTAVLESHIHFYHISAASKWEGGTRCLNSLITQCTTVTHFYSVVGTCRQSCHANVTGDLVAFQLEGCTQSSNL